VRTPAGRQPLNNDRLSTSTSPRGTDDNLARLPVASRELDARLRVAGMSDEEARQLPVTLDASTLCSFGSSTWTTDAEPIDVLPKPPVGGGRRSYRCDERRTDEHGDLVGDLVADERQHVVDHVGNQKLPGPGTRRNRAVAGVDGL
jgi:hypothetical protein